MYWLQTPIPCLTGTMFNQITLGTMDFQYLDWKVLVCKGMDALSVPSGMCIVMLRRWTVSYTDAPESSIFFQWKQKCTFLSNKCSTKVFAVLCTHYDWSNNFNDRKFDKFREHRRSYLPSSENTQCVLREIGNLISEISSSFFVLTVESRDNLLV